MGGAAGDRLSGDLGDDVLRGEGGDDILTGDPDRATAGMDTFAFGLSTGTDVVRDFQIGEDRIELVGGLATSDLTFTDLGGATEIVALGREAIAILHGVTALDLITASGSVFVTG
ncbi:MAG: hypothetical protein AAFY15_05370 [Cyanobacteria bacterium J06648_11]